MNFNFWKMHGAGNDFLLLDDRDESFPCADQAWIASLCTRRFGVGSDGVILIQPSDHADFRMRFFNPDGGEVEMCGNGARCVARLAMDIGAAPKDMGFETVAGRVRAQVDGDQVTLHMTEPINWEMHGSLPIRGIQKTFHSVNTGVPHVVMQVDDLADLDIQTQGAVIRYHDHFAPAGTNANFIQVLGADHLQVRTYERGVEAETLACGTGMVACGLIAGKLGLVSTPVRITCAGGDILEVNYEDAGESATAVTLRGPAAHVFQGRLNYPE